MLQKLTEEIAECYLRAEQCRSRAKHAIDPALKQDFLDMEQRWLIMARSYEFTAQLSDFTNEAKRWISKK